ncbi:hypothetical protein HNR42_001315 [Deinobacterium chartae]|uniref:Uncharacterized protein n=1 Tax=Deinobacterium chartae TaxID=521158 RepID=A0A841I1E7_9DEIO|nr:hypothetical protein [Deinobacterium chartae]MBB6097892.1 hypothetical protein [Deinobacterium chartae]
MGFQGSGYFFTDNEILRVERVQDEQDRWVNRVHLHVPNRPELLGHFDVAQADELEPLPGDRYRAMWPWLTDGEGLLVRGPAPHTLTPEALHKIRSLMPSP